MDVKQIVVSPTTATTSAANRALWLVIAGVVTAVVAGLLQHPEWFNPKVMSVLGIIYFVIKTAIDYSSPSMKNV